MKIINDINKFKDELIKDMQGLLRINSVLGDSPINDNAPFGEGIRDSLLYILNLGDKMGFKTLNIDNVAGHIEYGEGKEIIGILCHVDVVPAIGKWKYPPFSATIDNNKIYARGAIDDKGPIISVLYALKVLKDNNVKLNKRVRLILGTDEESGWRSIKKYFDKEEQPIMGFSPDADFPLIYGEKGIMSLDLVNNLTDEELENFNCGDRYNVVPDEASCVIFKNLEYEFNHFLEEEQLDGTIFKEDNKYVLKIFGKSAHAMEPRNGINAGVKLCKFLNEYITNPAINFIGDNLQDSRFKDMNLDYKHSEFGDLTVNVAVIKVDNKNNKIGLNLRYPINWDKEKFLKELAKQAREYSLTLNIVSDLLPHYLDKEDEFVKTLYNVYKKHTNDEVNKPFTIGGGTYARALKKGVAFGPVFPGRVDVVHQVNEYIDIDDVLLAAKIYLEAIYELGK
ncbi:MAG: dipeptidase PepV [Bacilli bacterium]|jgi:succinyl-diaminopimelate desuccinylase|nr:dipeptidase PepV [Bacilli bacterium]MDD4063079.1 dipeptidase PepV [Bacilli bacterium]MDD4481641.1 dipeptidase PepV [Bacilli bacterium]